MNILVVGVNYRRTALELREKLYFNISEQKNALRHMKMQDGVNECVLLSTCNRTEAYIYSEYPHFDSSIIEKKICELKGLDLYDLKKHFYIYSSVKAVKHLFNVASGLDSMVLGEDQILKQVKDAYGLAIDEGSSSGVLNTLFRESITVSKKVKTFTGLSKNSVSVGAHAVKLLENLFEGNLQDKCALVIGAGKIGSITLKNLLSKGIGKIYITKRNHDITSRNHGRTDDISGLPGNVETVDYSLRYSVIDNCDIVISSTTSPHYTITRDLLEKSVCQYKERVFIDLAVPRDIDTDIKELSWVRYFNIDHLQVQVDKNFDMRFLEISKAEEIINEFVSEYENWYTFRKALPVIKDVQLFADEILNEKIDYIMGNLKCATEEDKELVKISMKNAVHEILNKLTYNIRDKSSKEDVQTYFKCLGDAIK